MNGSKTQMLLLLKKNMFQIYSVFCSRFIAFIYLTFLTNQSYGQINIISMAFLSSCYKRLSRETSPAARSGERQLYLQVGSRQVKLEWKIMFRLGLLEYSSSILYQHSTDIVRS